MTQAQTIINNLKENLFLIVQEDEENEYKYSSYIYLGIVKKEGLPDVYVFALPSTRKHQALMESKDTDLPKDARILLYKPSVGKIHDFSKFTGARYILVNMKETDLRKYVNKDLLDITNTVSNVIQKIYSELAVDEKLRMPILMILHYLLMSTKIKIDIKARGKDPADCKTLGELFDIRYTDLQTYTEKYGRYVIPKTVREKFVETVIEPDGGDKLIEKRNEYWNHIIYDLDDASFFQQHVIAYLNIWYYEVARKSRFMDNYDMTKRIYDIYRHHISANAKKGYYTTQCIKQLCSFMFAPLMECWTVMDPCCGTGGFTAQLIEDKDPEMITRFYQNDCEPTAYIAWLSSKLRENDETEIITTCTDCFHPRFIDHVAEKPVCDHIVYDLNASDTFNGIDIVDLLCLNPPFGMKGTIDILDNPWIIKEMQGKMAKPHYNEWTFFRYNLEAFCRRGAWFFIIVPSSCVAGGKGNIKIKTKILSECEIWYVIKLRPDIFKPFVSNVQTVILIGRYLKRRKKDLAGVWKTKCVDFSQDDGGEIRRKKGTLEYDLEDLKKKWLFKIFNNKCLDGIEETQDMRIPECIQHGEDNKFSREIILTPENEWMYSVSSQDDTASIATSSTGGSNPSSKLTKGYVRKTLHKGFEKKRRAWFDENIEKIDFEKFIKESDDCEWRSVKITDLFEYVGKGKYKNIEDISDNGPYPLISGRYVNDGVSKRINKYDYEGNQYFTVPGCADIYNMYFQEENFAATTNVHILRLSKAFEYAKTYANEIAKIISSEFNDGKYSYHGNNLSRDRLLSEEVELPFNKKTNKIDFSITNVLDEEDIGFFKDVKITDIFEIMPRNNHKLIKDVKDTGEYPLISCSTKNHGVSAHIDEYEFDGDYISVATNGAGAGTCFDQHGKFAMTGDVIILKPKDTKIIPVLPELAFIMTLHLRMNYSYQNKCSMEKLEKEFIPQLPFLPNPDTGKLELSVDGIKNIYI